MNGYVYVIIGSISYGLLSSLVKVIYQHGLNANEVTLYQLMFGWSLLLIFFFFKKIVDSKKNKGYKKLTKKKFLSLLILGSTTGLTGILYNLTLVNIDASFAIILLFQFTWISFVLEMIFFKVKPKKYQILSLIPIFIGTGLATNIMQLDFSQINPLGLLFGLLSAVSYSIFLLTSSKIGVSLPYYSKSLIMVSGGLLLTMIIYNPFSTFKIETFSIFASNYGLILGFLGSCLCTLMFAKGGPMIGPTKSAIIGTLELPTVLIASSIILGEIISFQKILGIIFIFFGILIANNVIKYKKKNISI